MLKKKILIVALLFTIISSLQVTQVMAETALSDKPSQEMTISAKSLDQRAVILKKYLATHNSPLEDHAQDFIDAADAYGVDWKLVPAIAGVESTFGKHIPGGFNGWGWGVYGTQALYFTSWRDGIFTVTRGLKENYINKGLTDPYAMNRIYASSPAWGWKVAFFLNDIDEYQKQNPVEAGKIAYSKAGKNVGTSAELADQNGFKLVFFQ